MSYDVCMIQLNLKLTEHAMGRHDTFLCAGQRPARAWFFKIASVCECLYACVCLHVCLPPKLVITSGMIWTPYDWSNKFYGFYMAAVVESLVGVT